MTDNAINLERLQIVMPELSNAWQRKTDAAGSYNDAVKNVALQVNMEPGALKAYINAKMRDELEKLERQGEQLSLLLETFDGGVAKARASLRVLAKSDGIDSVTMVGADGKETRIV